MPLRLVPRKGSPYLYIRGTIRGQSVFESTGLVDPGKAEEALARRASELIERSLHGDTATRTFAEAALSYQEAGGDGTYLEPIIRLLGRRTLARIAQAEIDEAAAKLKPGASPATINRQIHTPISAVLHHAARKRWCAKPVIARPKQPKGRVRWISYAEAERLIEAAGHLRPLVIFLLCTGCRITEALTLEWREVDLSACHVSILNESAGGDGTKSDESRGVPLHPRAVAALANLPHRTGKVFRTHYGRVRPNGRQTPVGAAYVSRDGEGGGQVKTAWKAMLKRAGLSNFTPHDCRHTWATWHYRANHDLAELMELGGWKSVQMVMRYAHVNTAHLAPSINRIWGAEKTKDVQSPDEHEANAKEIKA